MPSPFRRRLLVTLVFTIAVVAAMACGASDPSITPPPGGPDTTDTVDTTPPPVPDTIGHIVVDSFHSASLQATKRYLVYVPASYSTSKNKKYPVAYFLHGATANEQFWVDSLRLDIILDSLYKLGTPEMIVVMPDGDNSLYHNWVVPFDYNECLARGAIGNEPATTFCVPQMHYGDYIANDLVAHIDSTYRTLATSQHRALAGYSMGGGGSLYLSFTHPNEFGVAASLSGGIFDLLNIGTPDSPIIATDTAQLHQFYSAFAWVDFAMANQYGGDLNDWRKYDPHTLLDALPDDSIPSMWMIVGTYDSFALPGNQTIHNVLTQRGVTHTYIEIQGDHTSDFWRAHDGEAAAWVADQIKPPTAQ